MRSTPAATMRPNSAIRASGVIWVGHRLFVPEEELRMETVRQMGNFNKRYANKAQTQGCAAG